MTPVIKSFPASRGIMGFAAAIAVLSLANPAFAGKVGDFTYELKDGSVTIKKCRSSASGAIVIPATISGRPVTTVGDFAFNYCGEITEVTIPEGVTKIGRNGFSDCRKLKKVRLPNSLKTLGAEAFTAGDLRSVRIPAGLKIISQNAFSANFRLHDVEIPEGVKVIGYQAFAYSSALDSVSLPASVETVTPGAFVSSYKIKKIEVAAGNRTYSSVDGVIYDKRRTLLIYCPEGKPGTLKVPEGVKRLATKSVSRCRSLKTVVLPDSLRAIESRAFDNCSDLISINLPNGLTDIGHHAFVHTSLGDVTIPASVERIGGYAFVYSRGIKNVYFNGNAPAQMGEHVFDSTSLSGKPQADFKIYFYEGKTGFTEPTWLGYNTESISPDAPVTNKLLFGAGWRN